MSVHSPLGATDGGVFGVQRASAHSALRRDSIGKIGIAGLLVSGLLIAVSAARTDALLPESVRPLPNWLAGPFGTAGPALSPWMLVTVLGLMFLSYVSVVRAAERLPAGLILMGIAALYALVVLAPPLLSTDVFSYQAYARMGALYGVNPYLHGPSAIALDPLYALIGAKWISVPSAYGPLFTLLGYPAAHLSIAESALGYKLLAAVAGLGTVALVWNAAKLRGVNEVKAAALVGLNPLIVIYGVGGGHNDLLMVAMLVAGISLLLQRRGRGGAAMIAIAAGVKLTACVFLPFAVAGANSSQSKSRRREVAIGAAIGTAFVLAIGLSVFGSGPLHLLSTLQKAQTEGDWKSIPGSIAAIHGLSAVGHLLGYILAGMFAVIFCWLLRRVWRGQLDWLDASGWMTVAMLVTAGSLLPWYAAWLMPIAALALDRRLWRAALWISGLILVIQLLGYLPHGNSVVL